MRTSAGSLESLETNSNVAQQQWRQGERGQHGQWRLGETDVAGLERLLQQQSTYDPQREYGNAYGAYGAVAEEACAGVMGSVAVSGNGGHLSSSDGQQDEGRQSLDQHERTKESNRRSQAKLRKRRKEEKEQLEKDIRDIRASLASAQTKLSRLQSGRNELLASCEASTSALLQLQTALLESRAHGLPASAQQPAGGAAYSTASQGPCAAGPANSSNPTMAWAPPQPMHAGGYAAVWGGEHPAAVQGVPVARGPAVGTFQEARTGLGTDGCLSMGRHAKAACRGLDQMHSDSSTVWQRTMEGTPFGVARGGLVARGARRSTLSEKEVRSADRNLHAAISFELVMNRTSPSGSGRFSDRIYDYKWAVARALHARPEEVTWHWQWSQLVVDPGKPLSSPMMINAWEHVNAFVIYLILTQVLAGLWEDETQLLKQALKECTTDSAESAPGCVEAHSAPEPAPGPSGDWRLQLPDHVCCHTVPHVSFGVNEVASVHYLLPTLMRKTVQSGTQYVTADQVLRRLEQVSRFMGSAAVPVQKAMGVGALDFGLEGSCAYHALMEGLQQLQEALQRRTMTTVEALKPLGRPRLRAILEATEEAHDEMCLSWVADTLFMVRHASELFRRQTLLACRPDWKSFEKAEKGEQRMYKNLRCTGPQQAQLASIFNRWYQRAHGHITRMQQLAAQLSRLPDSRVVPSLFLTAVQHISVLGSRRSYGQVNGVRGARRTARTVYEGPLGPGAHGGPLASVLPRMPTLMRPPADGRGFPERGGSAMRYGAAAGSSPLCAGLDDEMFAGDEGPQCEPHLWAKALLGPNAHACEAALQLVMDLQDEQAIASYAESDIICSVWLEDGCLTAKQFRQLQLDSMEQGVYFLDTMRLCQIAAEQERRRKIFSPLGYAPWNNHGGTDH